MKKFKFLFFVIFGVLGVVGLLYYTVNAVLDYYYLKKDQAYTISETVFVGSTDRVAGTDAKYTFKVNDKWYQGFTSLGLEYNGTKYFIKFYPANPNRNKATNIIADSSDVANLPPGGYKELPHH